ncbi:MAG TPA: citrate/2-methylcitrate synthase [Stellaceae bacterium]|nr:citrate/2-methylcitrate synthase [Stellaceae bacterium]
MADPSATSGLDNVVVADTVLSHMEPAAGKLWVRGVPLSELAEHHGYEGVVALLWDGFAGAGATRQSVQAELGRARAAAYPRLGSWLLQAGRNDLGAGVRACLAALPDESSPAEIVGALAVAVPMLARAAIAQPPVAPDPAATTAADVLRMLHGKVPDPPKARALDTYFTAMIDSGLGPSVFAARVIASTRASLTSAVLGAWCAFTGPLHGGAPGPTLDLLDELAAAEDIDAAIERKLRAGERLMGFGHRVFRGNDPRVAAMRRALEPMASATGRLAFARTVEERIAVVVDRVKPGRRLPANVEITAALLLDAVGIGREAFTAVFAIARCPGWIAHALEQQKTGRMFRPASRYVGPPVA